MTEQRFIWITRWPDFQHYRPERDRPPAWIKDYTKQLDDEAYLTLTSHQRAVLHDLRSLFARSHGKLTANPRRLTQRVGFRITTHDLEALNHAGFIQLVSRETLENRLEQLYSPPRARVEVEVEREKALNELQQSPRPTPTKTKAKRHHELLIQARTDAITWTGKDTDQWNTHLDQLEQTHKAHLTTQDRDDLWDKALDQNHNIDFDAVIPQLTDPDWKP